MTDPAPGRPGLVPPDSSAMRLGAAPVRTRHRKHKPSGASEPRVAPQCGQSRFVVGSWGMALEVGPASFLRSWPRSELGMPKRIAHPNSDCILRTTVEIRFSYS